MANEGQTQGTESAGSGTGAAVATPPAGAAGSSGTTGTAGTGTSSSQAAAPTATSTGYTYKEDRSQWIPPYRLTEESTKRQQLETALEIERRRVQALTGVTPQPPGAQKQEQIREAFFELFPQMRKFASLSDEQLDQLLNTPDAIEQQRTTELRQWERHGDTQMATLGDHVAAALGTDALDQEQAQDLRDAFSMWLKKTVSTELQQTNGAESRTLQRYEKGDPKLLEEFAGRYTKNWVEPARRQSTAAQTRRARPVPNSGDRSQVSSVAKPASFNSLDDRIDYAAKLFRERGGTFDR